MAQDQVEPDCCEVVLDDIEVAVEFRVWSVELTNYPYCSNCDLDHVAHKQKRGICKSVGSVYNDQDQHNSGT